MNLLLQQTHVRAAPRHLAALLAFVLLPFSFGASIDDASLTVPSAGDASLHILTPTLLELTVISAPAAGEKLPNLEQQVHPADVTVQVDGTTVSASLSSFRRRALYAPLKHRDLRVSTEVYLSLGTPLDGDARQTVSVLLHNPSLAPGEVRLQAVNEPLRFSPAIHVNQEGYEPGFPKRAFVGYFLGTAGELPAAKGRFALVDSRTGERVYEGELRARRDVGFTTSPRPYQNVAEADFTDFDTPGEYRVAVPGLGASLPFRIAEGEIMNFARAYALGLYHQRCGTPNELPYTRFLHDACHVAKADIPMPTSDFSEAWKIIAELDKDVVKPEHPEQQLRSARDQLYPFVKRGKIDVSGGHHDAGDYSKYTTNSASLVNALIFAVDSFPGVADLDNLGLPESGDGISDILQEAKHESDFLAKLQDDDGGFYFLVYPKTRRYENDVPPDHGDPQIVWPKTTSATAAAVAALAQCASSPEFRRNYPEEAKRYLAQALRGWDFLQKALAKHGARAYQRLTHYGDQFDDRDELAWAACELFVATGDPAFERKLLEWYPNPGDPQTWQWTWRHASFCYGNALRSYAFAASSGRLPRNKLDPQYLLKCEAELRRAGETVARASEESAYGISLPEASKRINRAGWFFGSDEAFDITVAYQLQRNSKFREAVLANLNYEAGANPVNETFVTGIGQRRQRELVNQFAQTDERVLPPSGIPIGSVRSDYSYLDKYKTELKDASWPADEATSGGYPLYDRWADAYAFNTEFVIANQGRMLASIAYWAAQTPSKAQKWKSARATIVGVGGAASLYEPRVFRLECPDLDLGTARITWEGRGQEPAFGSTFTYTPRTAGAQWVEAEAALPDGRRAFARLTFSATATVVYWVNGRLPAGATAYTGGGDTWDWIKPGSKPRELTGQMSVPQHESALAEGIHDHGFDDAEAKLEIAPGDILFAYVFIDPKNPPKTLMLEWNDGSLEHRAFWGPNYIPYGKPNTAGQRDMGRLPPAGRWVRLEVPAKAVGLEGRTLKGMMFRAFAGRARWDAAGKMTPEAKTLARFPPPTPR